MSNTFLETVAIDLKLYKGKILLSASAVIPNKQPKTIIKYVFKSWISLLGLPAKFLTDNGDDIHKDIFACLFSIHNTISLSCHEQVCLSGILLPSSGNLNDYVAHI